MKIDSRGRVRFTVDQYRFEVTTRGTRIARREYDNIQWNKGETEFVAFTIPVRTALHAHTLLNRAEATINASR